MLFNSYEFIFGFLPIALIGFFAIGRWGYARIAIGWLVAASLFFYGWWNPPYLLLLLFSIGFNYSIGRVLSSDTMSSSHRKWVLFGGIATNLALIGYFKYANFFASIVNDLLGTSIDFGTIVLPLAISFFTFQQIAYLVDAYREETKEYNFLKYSLFVSFFPQLIAGPIVHHDDVIPQFSKRKILRFDSDDMAIGLTTFSLGLFKKVVFADTIATYANPVFTAASNGVEIGFFQGWIGALAYTLQLYFDFSGYSDMAIGAARLFGIRLPLNFNSPYKSVSIADFWRRWHMTLSRFLRDYLYIPLGGNRKGEVRRYVNLMVTMLLGGLWHGAGWTFVLWGGLHGAYLVVHRWWEKTTPSIETWWYRWSARLVTFVAVVVSWVLFRAIDLSSALAVLRGMAGLNGIRSIESWDAVVWVVALLGIAFFAPNTQEWVADTLPELEQAVEAVPRKTRRWQWTPDPHWALVGATALVVAASFISQENEFIYFQF
ncbi:MAG: MBOAT family protein [Cyanobacteria bacterium SID2]|nr:MBOAT family protein [Cyanobacteria bacterium SID2]MBP0005982.1 MBOAT family protein [Cyanobacteria bacterium SBC]